MSLIYALQHRNLTRDFTILDSDGNAIIPESNDEIRISIGRVGSEPLLIVSSEAATIVGSSFTKAAGGESTNRLRIDAGDMLFEPGIYTLEFEFLDTDDVGDWVMVERHILALKRGIGDMQDTFENVVAPVVTRAEYLLSVTDGTWSLPGVITAYQWYRKPVSGGDPVAIAGETANTYLSTEYDIDYTMKCDVSCTYGGVTVTAESNYLGVWVTTGSERVVNGDFPINMVNWTAVNSTIQAVAGKGQLTGLGLLHARMHPTGGLITTPGLVYRLSVEFTAGVNAPAARSYVMSIEGGTVLGILEMPVTGTYIIIFTAELDTTYFDLRDPSDFGAAPPGSTWEFDNVSIKRIIAAV